ncbi:MAG: sulfotransferase family 2 domain-containing protein [Planctomycetes bacterium]|nr:sulfotransferase family 2 domain-containing protein [Planctomycetota bacterium]
MIDHERRIALLWSAKAGCTFAIKWFLHHLGHLPAALYYHPWIHRYRTEVYYRAHDYQTHVLDVLTDPGLQTVKIVRNPFSRAVSSYVHALVHRYDDGGLERFLGRPVTTEQRFTFREFVSYLESLTLTRCNVHHRLQKHPLEIHELVRVTHLVRLEESAARLPEVERELGFDPGELAALSRSVHHTERQSSDEFWGDRVPEVAVERNGAVVPQTGAFYDDTLQVAVATCYARDFESYGYDPGVVPD